MQKAMPAGRQGSAQILVLLLVIIILGGFYLYPRSNIAQNKTNPIADIIKGSNTYTDKEMGFEFVYANGFTAKKDYEEDFNKRGNGDFRKNFKGYVQYEPGKFLGAVVALGKDSSYDTNPFTLWIFDNPNNLTIDDWYKNFWYYPFVWGDFTYKGKVELAPHTEATISGQMGKSGIIDYQPGKPKFVYLSKDKKIYLFRIIGDEGDKILSTFKFL